MMYLKLRYRARLADLALVDQMADEVADICDSNGWKYHRWDDDWRKPTDVQIGESEEGINFEGEAGLRGIHFSPGPQCETIWLTFSANGMLNSLFTLENPTFTAEDPDYPWNRVKTGFDGAKTHIEICNLFRFLEKKYFSDCQMLDESGYWQHGDKARCEKWMDEVTRAHDTLDEEIAALESDPSIDPKTRHKIFYGLIKQFGERYKPDTQ